MPWPLQRCEGQVVANQCEQVLLALSFFGVHKSRSVGSRNPNLPIAEIGIARFPAAPSPDSSWTSRQERCSSGYILQPLTLNRVLDAIAKQSLLLCREVPASTCELSWRKVVAIGCASCLPFEGRPTDATRQKAPLELPNSAKLEASTTISFSQRRRRQHLAALYRLALMIASTSSRIKHEA